MAVAYASSTSFTDGNGTSITGVAKPASTAIDDVLVAQLYIESGGGAGAFTIASTGDTWTQVHTILNATPVPDFELTVWITVVANASSTIAVTWNGGSFWRDFAVHRFTGVHLTTPQDATATENTGTSTAETGLGITTATDNAHLVLCTANFDAAARSAWSSPLTERNDSGNVAMASGDQAVAGASGDKSNTITSSSWAAIMLALRSASGPPQFARPSSDVSIGGWTTDTGGTTNLFAAIDESSFNDSDFIQSVENPSADLVKIRLGSVNTPLTNTNHVVRYRYLKSATGGQQINIVVRLYRADGTTVVASQSHTNIDAVTSGSFTLSGAEADSIPDGDYATGLVLGVEATAV